MQHVLRGAFVAILCSVSTTALAQSEVDAAEPDTTGPRIGTTGGIADIVVTATRREERLQDIPVTVTAITNDTARGAGIREVRELTQVVPASINAFQPYQNNTSGRRFTPDFSKG